MFVSHRRHDLPCLGKSSFAGKIPALVVTAIALFVIMQMHLTPRAFATASMRGGHRAHDRHPHDPHRQEVLLSQDGSATSIGSTTTAYSKPKSHPPFKLDMAQPNYYANGYRRSSGSKWKKARPAPKTVYVNVQYPTPLPHDSAVERVLTLFLLVIVLLLVVVIAVLIATPVRIQVDVGGQAVNRRQQAAQELPLVVDVIDEEVVQAEAVPLPNEEPIAVAHLVANEFLRQ